MGEGQHNLYCSLCGGPHPPEAHQENSPEREEPWPERFERLQRERVVVRESDYPQLWTRELLEFASRRHEELMQERWKTPTIELDLQREGYGRILVKDESGNPTGTHKDRMAHAMAEQFTGEARFQHNKFFVEQDSLDLWNHDKNLESRNAIERYSLLTSGNGGMALARTFGQRPGEQMRLPPPKLLLDTTTDREVIQQLTAAGADVYLYDLGKEVLDQHDIATITNNLHGLDLTSGATYPIPMWQYYYFEYGKEVLADKPTHLYLPYGSGALFEGVVSAQNAYPSKTNVLGAEPEDPRSRAIMLTALDKPFQHIDRTDLALATQHYSGPLTNKYKVSEQAIADAYAIYKKQGITAGYSSAAALALYMTRYATDKRARDGKTIVVNTGRGIVKKDW